MSDRMFDPTNRAHFLNLAGLFEGGLVLVAFVIGGLAGVDPLGALIWDWNAAVWGAAAAIPLFALIALSCRYPLGPLWQLKQLVRELTELLGPPLSACRWYDLVLLSLLVGFSEELLFRGVLQVWLEAAGPLFGLIASNVLFGLAHLVTLFYAVLAGVIGCYLGLLFDAGGERNLLTPIMTHAVYDYLAFLLVVRAYRSGRAAATERDAAEGAE